MAKRKGDRKAARGSRKNIASRKAKRAARKAVVNPPSPAAAKPVPERQAEADNPAIREGAELTQLLTQAMQRVEQLTEKHDAAEAAKETRLTTIEKKLCTTAEGITDVYAVVAELTKRFAALPEPVDQEEVRRLASKMAEEPTLEAERRMMWLMEKQASQQHDRNKPPRPTIVARALFDLQTTKPEQARTPVAVFTHIREHGPHHLSPAILKALDRYRRPDGTVDKDASGKLGKHLDTRLDELHAAEHVNHKADQRTLTEPGLRLFDQWPEWGTRHDDVQCYGYARLPDGQGQPHDGDSAGPAGTPEPEGGPAAEVGHRHSD